MFTTESKLLFGTAAVVALGGGVYLLASSDRMGSLLFVGVLATAVFLGLLVIGRSQAATATGPVAAAPARYRSGPVQPTGWPAAAALASVLLLVGLVVDVPLLVLGGLAVALAVAGWFIDVWAGHLTGARPSAVFAHNRVVAPASVPLTAILAIFVVVVALSRVLLAVPKEASTAAALVVASSILVVGFVVSGRAKASPRALAGLLAALGAAVVVAGVVAAATGQRTIERQAGGPVAEVAKGVAFTQSTLKAVTTGDVVIHFQNTDAAVIHNIAVYTDQTATQQVFFGQAVNGLGKATYTFKAAPGTYFFRCEFHPQAMTGTLTVEKVNAKA